MIFKSKINLLNDNNKIIIIHIDVNYSSMHALIRTSDLWECVELHPRCWYYCMLAWTPWISPRPWKLVGVSTTCQHNFWKVARPIPHFRIIGTINFLEQWDIAFIMGFQLEMHKWLWAHVNCHDHELREQVCAIVVDDTTSCTCAMQMSQECIIIIIYTL